MNADRILLSIGVLWTEVIFGRVLEVGFFEPQMRADEHG
jgi:hypothetical protein